MAIVKKIKTDKVYTKPKMKGSTIKREYKLPTEPSIPSIDLIDYSFLLYGRKKIGKTSLVARFPESLFFLFEPGAKAQAIYKLPTDGHCLMNWSDVNGYLDNMKKNKHEFLTAVFDTGNKAYDLCLRHVVDKELNGKHPGQMKDYGASWRLVGDAFESVHVKIASMNMGFVVIAHEKFKDFEGADGKEYTRVEPRFSGSCNEFYEGIIDVIGHYSYIGKERWLQIRGDEFTTAGCRIEGRFLTPKGFEIYSQIQELDKSENQEEIATLSEELGIEQIVKIPMGRSANTAFGNLMRAFENKQTETFADIEDTQKGGALEGIKKKKKFVIKKKK